MDKEIYEYVTQNEVNRNVLKTLGNESGGSSDFSTAKVIVENHLSQMVGLECPYIHSTVNSSAPHNTISSNTTIEITAILYKNKCIAFTEEKFWDKITVTGDGEIDNDGTIFINGDCRIIIED